MEPPRETAGLPAPHGCPAMLHIQIQIELVGMLLSPAKSASIVVGQDGRDRNLADSTKKKNIVMPNAHSRLWLFRDMQKRKSTAGECAHYGYA